MGTDAAASDMSTEALVVMGVSGSGKTTVAIKLAEILGWEYVEGDDLHSMANVAKMRRGEPLTDDDRWPWLRTVAAHISERQAAGASLVVTCSALRRAYRDVLRDIDYPLRFVHIAPSTELIMQRMREREGHYMPTTLLPSQLATLEDLDSDEPGVVIDSSGGSDEVLRATLVALGIRSSTG